MRRTNSTSNPGERPRRRRARRDPGTRRRTAPRDTSPGHAASAPATSRRGPHAPTRSPDAPRPCADRRHHLSTTATPRPRRAQRWRAPRRRAAPDPAVVARRSDLCVRRGPAAGATALRPAAPTPPAALELHNANEPLHLRGQRVSHTQPATHGYAPAVLAPLCLKQPQTTATTTPGEQPPFQMRRSSLSLEESSRPRRTLGYARQR
jgi:hypothetical protein